MLFVPFCTDSRQSYLRVRYCARRAPSRIRSTWRWPATSAICPTLPTWTCNTGRRRFLRRPTSPSPATASRPRPTRTKKPCWSAIWIWTPCTAPEARAPSRRGLDRRAGHVSLRRADARPMELGVRSCRATGRWAINRLLPSGMSAERRRRIRARSAERRPTRHERQSTKRRNSADRVPLTRRHRLIKPMHITTANRRRVALCPVVFQRGRADWTHLAGAAGAAAVRRRADRADWFAAVVGGPSLDAEVSGGAAGRQPGHGARRIPRAVDGDAGRHGRDDPGRGALFGRR